MPGRGVHADGSDGHPVILTDEDPVLRAQADEIEREFGGRFTISARFGWFRADRADLPPGMVAAHFTADDAAEMRRQLAIADSRAA
jgi:hypothetical protein